MRVYPAVAAAIDVFRVRFKSQRSGSQSNNCSVVGFSPNANSPGNASRRYANGSILKLATVRVGPRKLVSVAALGRFIDAMTEAAALVTAEREMRRRFFQKSPAPNPFVDVSRSCRA